MTKKLITILLLIYVFDLKSQEKNIYNAFTLDTVLYSSTIARESIGTLSYKVKDAKLYYLHQAIDSRKKPIKLIKQDLNTFEQQVYLLDRKIHLQSVSDFDVKDDYLLMLVNWDFILYNLKTKKWHSIDIPKTYPYTKFTFIDTNHVVLYSWSKGPNKNDICQAIKYNINTLETEVLDSIYISGLNFLDVDYGSKFVDVNASLTAKVKPSEYHIVVKNYLTDSISYIDRKLESAPFINEHYIEHLSDLYSQKPRYAIFDSIDIHKEGRSSILAIKSDGDSMLYVLYETLSPYCECISISENEKYFDIWKFSKADNKWILVQSDIRVDNKGKCGLLNYNRQRQISKSSLMFLFGSHEESWHIEGDYLILTKTISEKVDIHNNIGEMFKKERYEDNYVNIYIFKYKLK